MHRFLRPAGVLVATVLMATVAACGGSSSSGDDSDGGFPFTQKNVWGTTEIDKKPTRVAVVSAGDRAIAYQLGIKPVIEWDYPAVEVSSYVKQKRKELGITEPKTYDGTDGTDFEAIAAAAPDVILAMNAYSMADDYEKLSKIAPVITFADEDDVTAASWQERVERGAQGLGLSDEADDVVAANKKVAADARAKHPELEGKTYSYLIIHPEQLTYGSYAGQKPGPVDDLGLVRPKVASRYSESKNAVSLENIDQLDADVLLVAYPFGDEGVISADKLESNKLFQAIPAVKAGRWAVLDSDSGLASDLAYPDVLAYPWVVDQITPVLVKALAGKR